MVVIAPDGDREVLSVELNQILHLSWLFEF